MYSTGKSQIPGVLLVASELGQEKSQGEIERPQGINTSKLMKG